MNDEINFKQYSGYLNAENSTNPRKFLHYWFVESQSSPKDDPLVLWLNGGPGCSSLGGFFTELGPFSVNSDGKTLSIRSASWNKKANVIFLESPSGVGYSYAKGHVAHTDDSTALQNYHSLKSFFEKFPEYKRRPFYITGESYGGVYLPTLGVLLDDDPEINFKGIAIGNGYLDSRKLGQALILYSYYHGFYGNKLWKDLSDSCCNSKSPAVGSCDFKGVTCAFVVNKLTSLILDSGMNPYNYAADCLHPKSSNNSIARMLDMRTHSRHKITKSLIARSLDLFQNESDYKMEYEHFRTRSLQEEAPCEDDTDVINYLDSRVVREALHIPSELKMWAGPCTYVDYTQSYPHRAGGLTPQMKKLITSKRNLAVLIYNGDLDLMCNFFGDELFSDDLGFPVLKDYQHWTHNDQVAGYYKDYKGFSFVTVKGAGHMVPTDKGEESLAMINRWLLK